MWLIDGETGTVYGHAMAVSETELYIQPLVEIFKDIRSQEGISLKLASPFGLLANLAKTFYAPGGLNLDASRYARLAIDSRVIALSSEQASTTRILRHFQKLHLGPVDIEIFVKILMRTGSNLRENLPMMLERGQKATLGTDAVRVQVLLDQMLELMKRENDKDHEEGQNSGSSEFIGFMKDSSPADEEDSTKRPNARKGLQFLDDFRASRRSLSDSSTERQADNAAMRGSNTQGAIARAYNWMRQKFRSSDALEEFEIVMLGLPGSGKTDLLKHLAGEHAAKDSLSTTGFTMKRIKREDGVLKLWEISSDERFRLHWKRFCIGAAVIVFVANSYEEGRLSDARTELQKLMQEDSLQGIPLLVLSNETPGRLSGRKLSLDEVVEDLSAREPQVALGRKVFAYAIDGGKRHQAEVVVTFLLSISKQLAGV